MSQSYSQANPAGALDGNELIGLTKNGADVRSTTGAIAALASVVGQHFITPEDKGAVGDGITNDTTAFQDLATEINSLGGAIVSFRPGAVYAVGRQSLTDDGTWMFRPETICNIHDCSKPVIVLGNGASMKFADGLKYGTFDSSGNRTDHVGFYEGDELATPSLSFEGILTIHDCTGHVHAENLDLDGNFANLDIGGQWGDGNGYQAPGDCLQMFNNTGGESTFNVTPHHAPRDCFATWRANVDNTPGSEHVFMDAKGGNRQALSIVGGRGYTFRHSRLHETGKAPPVAGLETGPGAGVDMESQVCPIRDVLFDHCEIADNRGPGALSDTGDTANVLFRQCVIVGTTNYSVWAAQPGFKFENCLIVGKMVGSVNYTKPDALQFTDCTFSLDPDETEYGAAYGNILGGFEGGSGVGHNISFKHCKFKLVDPGAGAVAADVEQGFFEDCTFDGPANTYLIARSSFFTGRNVITMPSQAIANMPGSFFGGELILNGNTLMRGSATYNPPSLAAGESTTTTVEADGAALGDFVEVSFSLDTQGIMLSGYVSAAYIVTVVLLNRTAGVIDLGSGTLSVRVTPKGSVA